MNESASGPFVLALRSLSAFSVMSCSFDDEITPVQPAPKTVLVCRNPSERI